MAFEQKDNSGSLFRNDKKEKPSHPNARGRAKIGGVEYFVDAWTKERERQGVLNGTKAYAELWDLFCSTGKKLASRKEAA